MALKAQTWRRRSITLTPLIDIIFLLLLFFMLSSTFTRYAELPLMNAAGGATRDAPPLFVQLRPDDVSLNGETMSLAAINVAIRSLSDQETATVLVNLSAGVSSQRLVDLLSILRGMPNLTVALLE